MLFKKLKRMTVLQVTTLLLAAALVMVVGGCSADKGSVERDPLVPIASDFEISNVSQTQDSVTKVIITPRDNKSKGEITIYYNNSTTIPQAAGTYAVTFDVAADGDWKAATKLYAGQLIVSGEITKNYVSGTDALSWGVSSQANVNVLTLGLTPGKDTTEINLNWYSPGAQAAKVAQVRFIRGTLIAGTELIKETGTVDAASTGFTQHKAIVKGLRPGSSYEYAVSSDGNHWTTAYEFKVPAATGLFKFAVVADPQLTTGNIDVNSRYPATGTTTAAGWIETMSIIMTKGVSFIASGGD